MFLWRRLFARDNSGEESSNNLQVLGIELLDHLRDMFIDGSILRPERDEAFRQ